MTTSSELKDWLVTLFGEQKGYIYAPHKIPNAKPKDAWVENYFFYPNFLDKAVDKILELSVDNDTYVAPSLFKDKQATQAYWKGTNFAWADFDGNSGQVSLGDLPEPSFRIQSSTDGHEHWYWRLDEYVTDKTVLEGLTRALAYGLSADKSGWDCNQVLRPPGTKHQTSGETVKFISRSEEVYSLGSFISLPKIEAPTTTLVLLPNVVEILNRYELSPQGIDLFNKPQIDVGSRSSALTRLGFEALEAGMTNDEIYTLLVNADDRWGKFTNLAPEKRQQRLTEIVHHCRNEKGEQADLVLDSNETLVSWRDFSQIVPETNWLFIDFLPVAGLGFFAGRPGVGKSTVSMRFAMATALGQDFLGWKNSGEERPNVAFVSLEMGRLECFKFMSTMEKTLDEEEKATISDKFFLMPAGYGIMYGDAKEQKKLQGQLETHNIKFVIFDSLKAATRLDDKKLDPFFSWINKELRTRLGITVIIIHHDRKPQAEAKGESSLDEMYGDTNIGAQAVMAVNIKETASLNRLMVTETKNRLAERRGSFAILREPNLKFVVVPPLSRTKEGENDASTTESNSNPFGG